MVLALPRACLGEVLFLFEGGRMGTVSSPCLGGAVAAFVFPEVFPEVVDATVLRPMGKVPIEYQDRQFYEERALYAGASVFDVFSFSFFLEVALRLLCRFSCLLSAAAWRLAARLSA